MGYNTKAILRDVNGDPIPQIWDEATNSYIPATNLSLRGKLANRPPANAVPAGTTYWAVDKLDTDDEMSVSDGANWVVI